MKRNMIPAMMMLSLLGLQTGCQNADSKSPEEQEKAGEHFEAPEQKTVRAGQFMIHFERKEKVYNQYLVQITAPISEQQDLRIIRTDLNSQEVKEIKPDSASVEDNLSYYSIAEYGDQKNFKAKNIKYEIFNGDQLVLMKQIVIKADLVIRGKRHISDLVSLSTIELSTLVFEPGATLYIGDRNLDISADELISEDGNIISFSEEERVSNLADDVNGKNSGVVYLSAGEARGTLRVNLNGTHGGKGIKGKSSSQQGGEGPEGSASQVRFVSHCLPMVDKEVPDVISFRKQCIDQEICVSAATRGGQGQPGGKGEPGLPGGYGGNGGALNLTVKQNNQFKVIFDSQPGKGGPGGEGGDGGPGGIGGPPGKIMDSNVCPNSRERGDQGPRGPVGEQGRTGIDGHIPESCITYVNEGLSKCAKNGEF